MSDFPDREHYDDVVTAAWLRMTSAVTELQVLLGDEDPGIETARRMGEVRKELQRAHDLIIAALMRARTRIVMDEHILAQQSFDRLGAALGVSNTAPLMWRNESGPKFYAIISHDSLGYRLDREAPRRRDIAHRLEEGAVVVPSVWKLDTLTDEELAQLDLESIYQRVKDRASADLTGSDPLT